MNILHKLNSQRLEAKAKIGLAVNLAYLWFLSFAIED